MIPLLAFLCLVVALVLLWQSGRERHAAGMPGGRVVYADTGLWQKVEKPLTDARLGLTGKPDYLVEHNGRIIPVEVKTGRTPPEPYDGHIYQLAAYCMLVHHTLGQRPPYGILHYPQQTYEIEYTAELENSLLDLLTTMRADERLEVCDRSHDVPARCARCGFRSHCDQRL